MATKIWLNCLNLIGLILAVTGTILLIANADVNLYKSILLIGLGLIISILRGFFN
ncbi:MAG: hypothetical protein AABX50_00885 [Nanoarchaeota archaeon]